MKYVGAAGLDMGGEKITSLGTATAETDASQAGQVSGVFSYGGSTWDLDPSSKIYLKFTGDPAPTTSAGDIVLEE